MPFEIIRNDITKVKADAIVNTANPAPVIGAGTDSAIHRAAGPKLLRARKKIGEIPVGCCRSTKAYDLPAKYVLHTVSPAWQDGAHDELALLRRAYDAALSEAERLKCRSVAFPLMAAGSYAFPMDQALSVAIRAFTDFLLTHEMQITLVIFNGKAFSLASGLFSDLKSFIDENYVREQHAWEYGVPRPGRREDEIAALQPGRREDNIAAQGQEDWITAPAASPVSAENTAAALPESAGDMSFLNEICEPAPPAVSYQSALPPQESSAPEPVSYAFALSGTAKPDAAKPAATKPAAAKESDLFPTAARPQKKAAAPAAAYKEDRRSGKPDKPASASSLDDFLKLTEQSFADHLLSLIDEKGLKDSTVYHRAQVSRQLFNKIINNKNYQPGKSTVIQLALALELDFVQTQRFLSKAGYALTRANKADLVVQYYIERKEYSIPQINIALFDCGLPPLKTGLGA